MHYAISGHIHYQCCSLQDFLAPGSIHSAYQQICWLIGNQRLIHEFIKALDNMLLLNTAVWSTDISHSLYQSLYSVSIFVYSLTYSLPVRCPNQKFVHISNFHHTCYTPAHFFLLHLINVTQNVHFIVSLSTAAVTACPGRCKLSMWWNCHIRRDNRRDPIILLPW